MALGEGITWNEALPDNDVVANQIDDYNRDLRVGVRSRMAREHVWSSSQTATSEGGHHNFVTLQLQTGAPTMAGTTGGALWVKSSGKDVFVTDSGANDYLVVASAKGLAVVPGGTGTQGSILICSSANGFGVVALAGSANGLPLITHSNTGAATWEALNLSGTGIVTGTGITALRAYDSGWFAIAANTNYAKTHNLGTIKVIAVYYFATDINGANANIAFMYYEAAFYGIRVYGLTTTTIGVRVDSIAGYIWDGTANVTPTHARIVLIALD